MGDQYLKELELHLSATLQKLQEEMRSIRSNRPSVESVENLKANAYGEMLPLVQLGAISVVPPREINIRVWDKNVVGPVMKAIEDAKIGLTPSNEDVLIRAFLPMLTDERRQELSKTVKKIAEQYRIQVRTRREESIKKVKAAEESKELNEDQAFKLKEKMQKAVDNANTNIETMVEKKLAEIQE
jgi:ribosome recycling factor